MVSNPFSYSFANSNPYRVLAGLPPFSASVEVPQEEGVELGLAPTSSVQQRSMPKMVSFDNYHLLWKGIATSHPSKYKLKPS